MRNIIGGEYEIDQNHWTLTIIRRKGEENKSLVSTGRHSFLVLEGVDNTGQRMAIEAHLGYLDLGNQEFDETKAQIYYLPTSLQKLQRLSQDDYVKRTWSITFQEKQQLEQKILNDQASNINYVKIGKTETVGFLGASLDNMGSTSSKEASVQKNQPSKEGNSSKQASYHSVDAALRKGHNCTSWAKEAVRVIRPDFKKSMLEKYIAVIPEEVIPNDHQINTEGCRLV